MPSNILQRGNNKRIFSINRCLFELGMPKKKAYYLAGGNFCLHDPLRGKKTRRVYERFTPDELMEMVEELRYKAVKRYHPDCHEKSKNKRWYEWKMSRINQAYDRAKHLLRHHGLETN